MMRRRPTRQRFGKPSFGRRVPGVDFLSIREEILSIEPPIELDAGEARDKSKVLLIHPAIKHRVTPIRPRLY